VRNKAAMVSEISSGADAAAGVNVTDDTVATEVYAATDSLEMVTSESSTVLEQVTQAQPGVRLETVLIADIIIDEAKLPREAGDQATVDEYTECLNNGIELPPPDVCRDKDGNVYLWDGWHRIAAHKAKGDTSILVRIHEGSERDAVLFAVAANDTHGLRRTNADKRKAVQILLQDPEWSQWSDKKLASICHVSDGLVARIRKSHHQQFDDSTKRKVERNGSTYTQDTTNIGKSKNAKGEIGSVKSVIKSIGKARERLEAGNRAELVQRLNNIKVELEGILKELETSVPKDQKPTATKGNVRKPRNSKSTNKQDKFVN